MNDHDWNLLLDRYISGECSLAEQALVRQGLMHRGESPDTVEALRRARLEMAEVIAKVQHPADIPSDGAAEALARLDQRLVDAGLRPAVTPRLRLRLEPSARWRPAARRFRAAVAACLVLASGAAVAWLVARPRGDRSPLAAADGSEFATSRGQRAVFRLVDGTEVMLDVDSRLWLSRGYGTGRRDVWLEGEAYFAVAHDAHPFAVHTARGVVRDVGTKFNVRAYRQDAADVVVVAEGVVAVRSSMARAAERLLKASQLAIVSPGGVVAVADSVDIAGELAWTRGELRFTNTPMGIAIDRLRQWYDIEVRLTDSTLASRPVTGVYADESLDQVLTLLTAAVDARFERHGKSVVIFPTTGGRHS